MATPEKLEIYKQRYDTYRHLDRLRWQIFQIAVGAGTLTLAFARGTDKPEWWVLMIVGFMLCIFGKVMLRIGHGINKNGEVLHRIGNEIGDNFVPVTKKWWKSDSQRIAVVLIVSGGICLLLASYNLWRTWFCIKCL